MDLEAIKEHSKALIPITLIFALIFTAGANVADYNFHFSNRGQEDYPPLTSTIINGLNLLFERTHATFLANLFINVAIPYILIQHITQDKRASWVFLYGSGLPFVMFFGWFIPQGLIHIFILLSIINPAFLAGFLMLGGLTHREFLAGFILVLAFIVLKRYWNDFYALVRGRMGWFNAS